jgi:hypothetical protein
MTEQTFSGCDLPCSHSYMFFEATAHRLEELKTGVYYLFLSHFSRGVKKLQLKNSKFLIPNRINEKCVAFGSSGVDS